MKAALKIATGLTWFNLIVWILFILLMALASWTLQMTSLLYMLFLLIAIPLNCYASLRLQKSIRHPAVPLSSQTPVGIRFVGFFVLFLAISIIINGFTLIGSAPATVTLTREQMDPIKNISRIVITAGYFRCLGAIVVFLGLCIGVNVILNFRLFRYYFDQQLGAQDL